MRKKLSTKNEEQINDKETDSIKNIKIKNNS
jgi:hypothetical protein